MEERIYTAEDGAEISYYITGQGKPLFCVHGSGRDKEQWERYGWLKELEKHFTVIAMDIRGFGKSSVFHDAQYYAIDRILGDIRGIMKECGIDHILYFGHSYGATIGFQAIMAGLPIGRAVLASGSMDDSFFRGICPKAHEEYANLAEIKRNGDLNRLTGYSAEDIAFIKSEDIEKFCALFGAWEKWKPVPAEMLSGKVAMYTGTLDHNTEMVESTTQKQAYFHQLGIETMCFEGLDHENLVSRADICLPWVLNHLEDGDER